MPRKFAPPDPLLKPCQVCKVEAGQPCRSNGRGTHYGRAAGPTWTSVKVPPKAPVRPGRTIDPARAAEYKAKAIAKSSRRRPARRKKYPTQDPGHGKLLPPADAQALFARLRAMNIRSLAVYYGSRQWRDLRDHYKQDPLCPNFCWVCQGAWHHLHHVTYERLGRESRNDIVALCADCHEATHELLWARTPGVTLANAHHALKRRREVRPAS